VLLEVQDLAHGVCLAPRLRPTQETFPPRAVFPLPGRVISRPIPLSDSNWPRAVSIDFDDVSDVARNSSNIVPDARILASLRSRPHFLSQIVRSYNLSDLLFCDMLRIPANGYKPQRDYVKKEPRLVRCDVCGAEFKAKRVDARACSGRCRKVRHLRLLGQLPGPKPVHQVTCEICLAEFESRRQDARTCSPRCRKALSRSSLGHLDRLERVVKSLDKAQARKERKTLDEISRNFARHFGPPMDYGQKTEFAFIRRNRQWKARMKHLKNVLEAIERSA